MLQESLSPGEWARAGRFRQPADRDRFVAMRTVLRDVLARYLQIAPGSVSLGVLPGGKPVLLASAQAGLHFNLAHSGRLGLLAVSARPVGIDVEFIDPALEIAAVVRHAFTPAEQAELRATLPAQRRARFYLLWTIKEAMLKAAGTGLPGLDRTPALSAWHPQVLEAGDAYAAAVAHGDLQVTCWDWAAQAGARGAGQAQCPRP